MRDFLNIPTYLSFDDVMIIPTFSDIKSRSEPNTSTKVGFINLDLPIISSPMDTVTEYDMAVAMSEMGGMGIIHRFMSPTDQGHILKSALNNVENRLLDLNNIKNSFGTIGVAIGVGKAEFSRLNTIADISGKDRITTVAIDVANGYSSYMGDMIKMVRDRYGNSINIIAGNVATGDGYNFLAEAGADAVRAGIGGGCFIPGTIVYTKDGSKKIEDISIGDVVRTHTGSLMPVINTMTFDIDEEIVSINGIWCTKNHEFYILDRENESLITKDDIHSYARWVHSDDLDSDRHILLDRDFNFVNISSKNYSNYKGFVFDLTVERDHSYIANNIIVHNSICKTRIQTGIGSPTLSTIFDSVRFKKFHKNPPSLIADGGIRYPGDFAKSIAAGADAIMVGRIIAASNESPGEVIDGFKNYRGMASKEVQIDKRGGMKAGTCAEGVSTMIKCSGPVSHILDEFRGGLASSMTYVNARSLSDFRSNSEFIRITSAGIDESHAFGTKK